MTATEMTKIKHLVVGMWPMARGWTVTMWKQWHTELAAYPIEEVRAAVLRLETREYPPGVMDVKRQVVAKIRHDARQRLLREGAMEGRW